MNRRAYKIPAHEQQRDQPLTSTVYVYAYVAFALAYLISTVILSLKALFVRKVLTSISRAEVAENTTTTIMVREMLAGGQRMVDYAQLGTLLPLTYIVTSVFLGSRILLDRSHAGAANTVWVVFTLIGIGASILLAVRGRDAARAAAKGDLDGLSTNDQAALAGERIARRLGMSLSLLALVVVFMTLNLWSIVTNLDTLLDLNYVL
ncbi:MAG: hypothetical protein JXE06_02725 [Coriobacteriia bacterium]|nr:hypothetical protein [Coriobacteriia bacterium]MBN2823009.1 hypothetical protein [Coriobacteriia bacterium]